MRLCTTCGQQKPANEFPRDLTHRRCTACKSASAKRSYQRHKDAVKAKSAKWQRDNRDKSNATRRQWAKKNLARRSAVRNKAAKERYYADVERSREYWRAASKRWRKANPEAWKVISYRATRKRQSQKAGAGVVERVDYERICIRDRMRCHICRKKVAARVLEFDHVIPLSKGGEHTERNIAVSHRSCNRSKHAKVTKLF